jgi:acid phosphatase
MTPETRVPKAKSRRGTLGCCAAAILILTAPQTSGRADVPFLPRPAHVVVVVEENHSFDEIVGNDDAPFINALVARGALLTDSHAVTHPSQPNYLALFSGSTQGVVDDSTPHAFDAPNLGGELIAAGRSFVGYAQSLPRPGWTGPRAGAYTRATNPWVNFVDVPPSSNLPFAEFPTDFASLPTVSFVVPDLLHDMHSGSVRAADAWLRRNLDAYATWAEKNNSLLIVTWDEDDKRAGNRIPTVLVGPMVKPGRYDRPVTHYDVLRTIEDMYGLPPTGEAAHARALTDVWNGPTGVSLPGAELLDDLLR